MPPSFAIAPFDFGSEPLLEQAIRLLAQVFGAGDHLKPFLLELSTDSDAHVVSAQSGPELAGIGIARVLKDGAHASKSKFGPECALLLEGRRLGSLQNVAVAESHRRTGVGLELGSRLFHWLQSRGCEWVLADAWNHGMPGSSHSLLERAGFRKLGVAEDFYLEASLRHGYVCRLCGTPCRCSATLYGIELSPVPEA